ncbi:MAG: cytochrome c biogenesis protein CcmG/thiol:disulfide interchange protein DsbE [Oceanicoccus sp.]|jgi:cytochrome c biogenesis protein CcmG/thiol:disulfide interchange protein DsbE
MIIRIVNSFLLLIVFTLSAPVLSYQKGDVVDPEIIKTLNLDPNKLTIIDFFASWCASCKKEIPMLDAMELDESKVELLGVCTDKKIAKGKAFQEKLNIQFRVYNDNNQEIVSAFGPFGMPAIYFVQGGIIKQIHFGAMPKIDKIVQKDIDKILAGQ